MSATNRGSFREPRDFYPTPMDAVDPLLNNISAFNTNYWEPACGDGRIVRRMTALGFSCNGDDLNNGYDFLLDNTKRDAVITNPPYSLDIQFCIHALEVSTQVYMLLRLNFLGSQARREWWRKNEPSALFVLSKRPSFVHRRTDACEYAWFYWGNQHNGIKHL